MTITDPENTKTVPQIEAMRSGFDGLQAWADAHPDHRVIHSTGTYWVIIGWDFEPAEVVRALIDGAAVGSIEKIPRGESLHVRRNFGGDVTLTYVISDRDQVCERVVTGTETVEIPDPDAPKVTVEREIVEWKCAPILAGTAA